jgi:glutamate racemase
VNRDASIGIIDSGVGGLTVARAIIDQLPGESIRYIGDTANGPYGPLPIAEVREHALGLLDQLAEQGVKLLVIACNTASAAMFRDAKERYADRLGIPVVEVIQPAVRTAVARTRTKHIGVIGTVGTIKSGAYQDSFVADPEIQVTAVACPRFVEFVEAGITSGDELFAVANEYLAPLKAAHVDTLLLGCTHYPLISAAIQYVMGPDVSLVSSDDATAYDVYQTLVEHNLLRTSATPPVHSFETTGNDRERFRQLAHRFLGLEIDRVDSFPTSAITLPTAAELENTDS